MIRISSLTIFLALTMMLLPAAEIRAADEPPRANLTTASGQYLSDFLTGFVVTSGTLTIGAFLIGSGAAVLTVGTPLGWILAAGAAAGGFYTLIQAAIRYRDQMYGSRLAHGAPEKSDTGSDRVAGVRLLGVHQM